MKKVRGIIALLAALVIAGLAAMGVYSNLQPSEAPAPPPEKEAKASPPPPPEKTFSQKIETGMRAVNLSVNEVTGGSRELAAGDRVDVLAVATMPDVPEGRIARLIIAGARVMAVEKPAASGGRGSRNHTVTLSLTPDDAAILASADPGAKIRLAVRNPKDDGTTAALAKAFSPGGGTDDFVPQERDLKVMIKTGMRAITVEALPTDGVAGVLRPGDRVDVVVTCPWGNTSGGSEVGAEGVVTETHRNSKILLQNIRILATDHSLAWDADANRQVGLVTLEVTPADAEKLTVLSDSKKGRATIRLIGRNQSDHQRVATRGAELLDLISEKVPYTSVELIRGSQRQRYPFYKPNTANK